VTNDAARLAGDPNVPSRCALMEAGLDLVRLFSPEHGLGADAADGAAVGDGVDSLTGLPVISLYGNRTRPERETLAGLDAVLFDIPDIGARFYTYIWTLWHVLEACAETGIPIIVLDRPNPLGGELEAVEGPLLVPDRFGSFVGRASIPIRHSLTVGELARLWNGERNLKAGLRVVPCSGWVRSMQWPDTGLPFVPTSPAIRTFASALLYPGLCLFEATNLSVGRGTDLPFQAVGAPGLPGAELARRFNGMHLPGVEAEPHDFTPLQRPYAGVCCHGVRLHVMDRRAVRPVRACLHLIASAIRVCGTRFQWSRYPTAANPSGEGHFERLIGQEGIRVAVEQSPADLDARVRAWTLSADWAARVESSLMYPQA